MYKIIGADQREYGPVPAERVREWILAGRVNAATRLQSEDGAWQSAGDVAEFQGVLRAQAAAAKPPPKIAAPETDRIASTIVGGDYRVDIGEWFSRGWRLLLADFWLLAGATAVIVVLGVGVISFPPVGVVAILLLGFVLWGSLQWLFLKRIRGQRADMGDAFAGFTVSFVPLMLGGLVIQALTLVGLALCLVPGIYMIVIWWGFVPLLIIDKQMDFWPAMELSRKVVNAHWWPVSALILCVTVVGLSGLLLFGVGVVLTGPLAVAALVYGYQEIFGKVDPRAMVSTEPAEVAPAEPVPGAPTNPSNTALPNGTPGSGAALPPSTPRNTLPQDGISQS